MSRWCSAPLRILILTCVVCAADASPLGRRGALSFSSSLRLTRSIRSRVQQLLAQYKQQLFGDELFESRELTLHTLPAVTVSFQTWLHMQDAERLRVASHYLQTFWTHLEEQRQQLERERDVTKERREQRKNRRGKRQPTLCQSFAGLQVDLRDLMKQVSSQLNSITQVSASTASSIPHPLRSTSSPSPIPSMHHSTGSTTGTLQSPTGTDGPRGSAHSIVWSSTAGQTSVGSPQPTQQTTTAAMSRWVQHLNGYVILRDLERYLSRLARDYTVLQTKY